MKPIPSIASTWAKVAGAMVAFIALSGLHSRAQEYAGTDHLRPFSTNVSRSQDDEMEELIGEISELYKALSDVATGKPATGIGAGANDHILAELIDDADGSGWRFSGEEKFWQGYLETAMRQAQAWARIIGAVLLCIVTGILLARVVVGITVAADAARIGRGGASGLLMPPWLWAICIILGGLHAARLYLEARRAELAGGRISEKAHS